MYTRQEKIIDIINKVSGHSYRGQRDHKGSGVCGLSSEVF